MYLDRCRFLFICSGFVTIWLLAIAAHRSSIVHKIPKSWSSAPGSLGFHSFVAKPNKFEPGEVLLITASTGLSGFLGIPGLKDMVYEDRMSYALKWGYDFMWANMTSYSWGPPICWDKIPILQEALIRYPKAKWLWWQDMDLVMMNHNINLYDWLLSDEAMARHLDFDTPINLPGAVEDSGITPTEPIEPKDVNLLVAYDQNGLNAGSLLFRRSEWLDIMLDLWVDPIAIAQDWGFAEQDGLVHMIREFDYIKKHTGFVSQKAINEYYFMYTPGDFLVHFAGCRDGSACAGQWAEYWDKRGQQYVPPIVREKLAKGTAEIENIQMGEF